MSEVLTQAQDGVLIITINRPEARNAINGALRDDLKLGERAAPWSDSVLIALLATATPLERGAIIRELEDRRQKP